MNAFELNLEVGVLVTTISVAIFIHIVNHITMKLVEKKLEKLSLHFVTKRQSIMIYGKLGMKLTRKKDSYRLQKKQNSIPIKKLN
jgi:hypothetical protein